MGMRPPLRRGGRLPFATQAVGEFPHPGEAGGIEGVATGRDGFLDTAEGVAFHFARRTGLEVIENPARLLAGKLAVEDGVKLFEGLGATRRTVGRALAHGFTTRRRGIGFPPALDSRLISRFLDRGACLRAQP